MNPIEKAAREYVRARLKLAHNEVTEDEVIETYNQLVSALNRKTSGEDRRVAVLRILDITGYSLTGSRLVFDLDELKPGYCYRTARYSLPAQIVTDEGSTSMRIELSAEFMVIGPKDDSNIIDPFSPR